MMQKNEYKMLSRVAIHTSLDPRVFQTVISAGPRAICLRMAYDNRPDDLHVGNE